MAAPLPPPVRVDVADDAQRYNATDQLVWFAEPLSVPVEQVLASIPVDRRFAAYVDDADPATYAAIYGVRPMTLSVPGRSGPNRVRAAGLTWVGVHPDHRRRGLLTAMLRDHLERTRAEGVALSVLHASEPAIYGRHGYGLASHALQVRLARGTSLRAPGLDRASAAVGSRLRTASEPGIAKRVQRIEERVAADRLGAVTGELAFYEVLCAQFPEGLRGREPRRVLIAECDGEEVGYAFVRRIEKWDRERPEGTVTVERIVGTPAARLALLRRLLDLDLTASVDLWGVDADDELLAWTHGPRGAAGVETYDSLWVRLVDLPAAVAQRSYDAPCDVVVDVVDEAAPWNAGVWRIVVDADRRGDLTPTDRPPDLRLPVEAIGAAYLGAFSLVTRRRAGLVEELRPGAAAELWRSLRADRSPAAAIGF